MRTKKTRKQKAECNDFSTPVAQYIEEEQGGLRLAATERGIRYLCDKYPEALRFQNISGSNPGQFAIFSAKDAFTLWGVGAAFEDRFEVRFTDKFSEILRKEGYPVMHPEVGLDIAEATAEIGKLLNCSPYCTPSRAILVWDNKAFEPHSDPRIARIEEFLTHKQNSWQNEFLRSVRYQLLSGKSLSPKQEFKCVEIAIECGYIKRGGAQ